MGLKTGMSKGKQILLLSLMHPIMTKYYFSMTYELHYVGLNSKHQHNKNINTAKPNNTLSLFMKPNNTPTQTDIYL